MSRGEKWYNWTVYRGINYWINLIGSVAITDYFVNLGGKPKLDRVTTRLAKLLNKFGLDPATAARKSEGTLTYLALTSGGWILLAPLKFLEDRKRPVVYWLNQKFGIDQTGPDGQPLTANDIHLEKEQPKQPWWRVIGRRCIASAAVPVAGNVIDYTWGKDNTTSFVMSGMSGNGGINKIFRSSYFPGGKWLAENPRAQSWMNFAVLDSIFTEITASIMWLTNGARKAKRQHEVDQDDVRPAGNIIDEFIPGDPVFMPKTSKTPPPAEKAAESTDGGKKFAQAQKLSHTQKLAAETSSPLQPGLG